MNYKTLKIVCIIVGVCILTYCFYMFHLMTYRKLSCKILKWQQIWHINIDKILLHKFINTISDINFSLSYLEIKEYILKNDNYIHCLQSWQNILPHCSIKDNIINSQKIDQFLFLWIEQQRDIISSTLSIPIYTEHILLYDIKLQPLTINSNTNEYFSFKGVPSTFDDFSLNKKLKKSKKMQAHRIKIYLHLNLYCSHQHVNVSWTNNKNDKESIIMYPGNMVVKKIIPDEAWPYLNFKNNGKMIRYQSLVVIFYTRPSAIVGL